MEILRITQHIVQNFREFYCVSLVKRMIYCICFIVPLVLLSILCIKNRAYELILEKSNINISRLYSEVESSEKSHINVIPPKESLPQRGPLDVTSPAVVRKGDFQRNPFGRISLLV